MTNGEYKYLGPKRGSLYRQDFVKGRNCRAQSVYLDIVGPEQMTPEQARQLLDAQKDDEHMLPIKPEKKSTDRNRPFKDW